MLASSWFTWRDKKRQMSPAHWVRTVTFPVTLRTSPSGRQVLVPAVRSQLPWCSEPSRPTPPGGQTRTSLSRCNMSCCEDLACNMTYNSYTYDMIWYDMIWCDVMWCAYIYVCMYVCMYGWMDGWMDVWMYGCMDVWMYDDVWWCMMMYGCMDVWMYGCMDVWMYGCMYVCMYVCIVTYMCILILVPVKIHYISVVTIIMVVAFGGGPIALQSFVHIWQKCFCNTTVVFNHFDRDSYGVFLKWGYPYIIHFNRIFHYKHV